MPTEPETPAPYMLNAEALPWVPFSRGRFASEDKDLTEGLRARKLSCVLTRIPPGQVSAPYHFHHVGEELFLVIAGQGTLRYEGETRPVGPGDVVSCPPGPGSAHQFLADAGEALVYYAISTQERHEICEYPDSGKIYAVAHVEHGRQAAMFRHADRVEYWHGEAD
jgi:uncharacterized cupin superfamily protein